MMLRIHPGFPVQRAISFVSGLLIAGGIVGIGIYAWSEADRRIYEREFLDPPPPPLSVDPLPSAPVIPAPVPVDPLVIGQIEIPALSLKAVIRSGVDAASLRRAVGHVPGTALPGEPGNSVLAGHRDTVFAPLKAVEKGQLIRVKRRDGRTATYRVDSLAIVERDAVDVMNPSSTPRLTLITCYPFEFLGPSPRRLIVGATRINAAGKAAALPAPRVSGTSPSPPPGKRSSSARAPRTRAARRAG